MELKAKQKPLWPIKNYRPAVQRSLAGRYPLWVQLLALGAFAWSFVGWLNESWLFKFDSPIWLNRYTEYAIILIFAIWRIRSEKNPYTRKRLLVLAAIITTMWWLIPWLFPFVEPYVGFLGSQPVFPSLHTPGTMSFFLILAVVFLFGRRIICGWGCPCVAIREVVGFPFRYKTMRSKLAWRLRHVKWLFFIMYLVAGYAVINPLNSWSASYLGIFAMVVIIPYFLSMLLSPLTGNRAYCRYLCPFGATFGLLNRVGMFRLDFNQQSCTSCELCNKVCDMGIPVMELGKDMGKIDVADCMGCGRCVSECPSGTLAFYDLRNLLAGSLRQDRKRLRDLAAWQQPAVRLQAVLFVLVLLGIFSGAAYFASTVGFGGELTASLGALCGFSSPPIP